MSTEEFPKPLTAAGARATSAHGGPPFPPDVRDEEIAMVLDVEFPIAIRGYDRTAVDAYVHKVSRLISDLEASRSPQSAIRYALEQVSEQTRAILQQAHDSADAVTSQSQVEASERLQRADRESTAIREAAERRVREIEDEVADIWQERERLLAEMRDTASRLTEVVDAAAEQSPPAALTFEDVEETAPLAAGDLADDERWLDDDPPAQLGTTPPPPVAPVPEPDLADAPPPLPEQAAGPVAFADEPGLGAMDEPAAPIAAEEEYSENGFDRTPIHPLDAHRPQDGPSVDQPPTQEFDAQAAALQQPETEEFDAQAAAMEPAPDQQHPGAPQGGADQDPFGHAPDWEDAPADGEMRLELASDDEFDRDQSSDDRDSGPDDDLDTAERQRP